MTTPLTDAINALTTYANTVTGASDQTLSDAVGTLAAGYGGMTIDQFIDHSYPRGVIETDATSIITQTFRERSGITSFIAPNCTTIGGYAFYKCTALTNVSIPNCRGFPTSDVFNGCSNLVGIVLPSATNGNYNATFKDCPSFEYADFGTNLSNLLSGNTFVNCTSLSTLVFRRTTSIVPIWSTTFTGSTAASGGSGITVYIPKVLYDHLGDGTALDYLNNSAWATYYGYGTITFAKIEGSYYETHYADGTPIE